MKKITFLALVLFGLLITATAQPGHQGATDYPELDAFILEQMDVFHVPGLSACIIIGDSVLWNNNYGYMNLDENIPVSDSTLFNVFSIGKSLTTACVMQLWDEGLLGLDQNINDFLLFPVVNPWNGADSISARMLMCHSSSINDWNFDFFITIGDPSLSLSYFLENYLASGGDYYSINNYYNALPGTTFHYDNYGAALNGLLVEPLTGTPFHQYADEFLLTPLEMPSSAWFLDDLNISNLAVGYTYWSGSFWANEHRGHPAYPAVSLRSTALELANYDIMLLNHGVFKNVPILSSAAIDSMCTVQNPLWSYSYGTPGLGLFQRNDYGDRIVWGHNGGSVGGYAAHLYFCPEENTGVVVTTNSEQYVDSIMVKLFDYAALIVVPAEVTDIMECGFTLNWHPAPAAMKYYLDISYNFLFTNYVEGFENLDAGADTTYEVTGLEPGTQYYCRLRAFDGEETGPNSSLIPVSTLSVGIDEGKPVNSFRFSPNPVREEFTIEIGLNYNKALKLSFMDILGNEVMPVPEPGGALHQDLKISVAGIPSGIYFLRLQAGDEVITRKVVKQ